jgi:hypothetical protein
MALADGNTGLIYGTVLTEGSQRPLCAITVTATNNREPPQKVFTRPDGSFHFLSVSPGYVRLTIGPTREVRDITVSANLETYVQPVYINLRHGGLRVMKSNSHVVTGPQPCS